MKRAKFTKAINPIENIVAHEEDAESTSATNQGATVYENPGRKTKATTARHVDAVTAVRPPKKKITKNKVGKEAKPELLMVYLSATKTVGIKVYHNKPEFFNEEEEEEWMEQSRKDAIELKMKLETSQVDIVTIMDRIVLEPKRRQLSSQETDRSVKELCDREDDLFMERDFVFLCDQLNNCLGERHANIGLAFTLLEKFNALELKKIMLLRNPNSVKIIQNIRRYVGNLDRWQMNKKDTLEFNIHAQKIRDAAFDLYESFKKLFGGDISGALNFWEWFSKQVEIYKMYTKNIKKSQRMILTQETYDKLVEAKDKEAAEKASTPLADDGGN